MAKKGVKFVRPDTKEIIAAIELEKDKSQFMEFLRKCTDPAASGSTPRDLFPPITTPGPDDWLSSFPTNPDPFHKWHRRIRNHVSPRKKTIYILPLGEFTRDTVGSVQGGAKKDALGQRFLNDLESYTSFFFPGMIVKLLKEVPLSTLKCQSRHHDVGYGVKREQLMIPGIFAYMKNVLPQDAYCMLAVTMSDLYPDESWNFVFGQASLDQGIGVFSFARHHPYFFEKDKSISVTTLNELSPQEYQLVQWRAIKVLTHEIIHMFGLKHCVYFTCLMNGSNHAEESDSKLTFLCPVCLRKVQNAVKFDFIVRYEGLLKFFQERIISKDVRVDKFFQCVQWLEMAITIGK